MSATKMLGTISVSTVLLQSLVEMAGELATFRDLSDYREARLKQAEVLLAEALITHRKRANALAEVREEAGDNPNFGSW